MEGQAGVTVGSVALVAQGVGADQAAAPPAEPLEKATAPRNDFEAKRMKHYNMAAAMKEAKRLMAEVDADMDSD